jgi:hypothetical protein
MQIFQSLEKKIWIYSETYDLEMHFKGDHPVL